MIKTSKMDLRNHLISDLGIKHNDSVFLFSGMKGIGLFEGGPEGVLEVFEDTLTNGIFFIPTFSYSWSDRKKFDPLVSPAPLMGVIASSSIGRDGYKRTSNPNFSVSFLTQGADNDSQIIPTTNDVFGKGSIFYNIYMCKPHTKVLLLGGVFNDCEYRSTFIHTAQQLENAWYRYLKTFNDPTGKSSSITQFVRYFSKEEYKEVNGANPIIDINFPITENFEMFSQDLEKLSLIRKAKFRYSNSRIVTVKDTIEVFRKGLKKNMNYGLDETTFRL